MIYCLNPNEYPKPDQIIEEISYRDENDFEWKIIRVNNGFFVTYLGNAYFKENTFSCHTSRNGCFLIRNTNLIFFKCTDFDTFVEVRNVIKIGYTDDIWETFEELFTERLEHDQTILESEL